MTPTILALIQATSLQRERPCSQQVLMAGSTAKPYILTSAMEHPLQHCRHCIHPELHSAQGTQASCPQPPAQLTLTCHGKTGEEQSASFHSSKSALYTKQHPGSTASHLNNTSVTFLFSSLPLGTEDSLKCVFLLPVHSST